MNPSDEKKLRAAHYALQAERAAAEQDAVYEANLGTVADPSPQELPRDFEMFTPEGNRACEQIVLRISAEITERILTRNMLPARIEALCQEVAKEHGEVYDTEPQYHLAERISALCLEQNWQPVSRWDW